VGRFIRRWFVLPVVGLLGSLSAHAEAPVWALKGAHNTVYLAGSVHLLRAKDATLPSAFDRAYADAEALVMEIDLDDLDPAAAQTWMLTNGMFTDGQTLSGVIGQQRFDRVEKEGTRLGLPVEALEQLEPWLVAMTLAQLQYMKLGFDPEQGVEKQLQRKAMQDHKEITGLETLEEQLGLLAGLSATDQAKFLDLTLEEMHEMEGETESLLGAWRTGNAQKLASMLSDEYKVAPSLYRMLIEDRNRRWMPQIEKLLKGDKDYLIVVGALHLVGNGGLLQLTKAKGFEAKQLQ
jgi:uncharacterized protein YbaP (TraB family)